MHLARGSEPVLFKYLWLVDVGAILAFCGARAPIQLLPRRVEAMGVLMVLANESDIFPRNHFMPAATS
jgi:hypothetical protein